MNTRQNWKSQLRLLSTPLIVTNFAGPLNVILSGFDCIYSTLPPPHPRPRFHPTASPFDCRSHLSQETGASGCSICSPHTSWNHSEERQCCQLHRCCYVWNIKNCNNLLNGPLNNSTWLFCEFDSLCIPHEVSHLSKEYCEFSTLESS